MSADAPKLTFNGHEITGVTIRPGELAFLGAVKDSSGKGFNVEVLVFVAAKRTVEGDPRTVSYLTQRYYDVALLPGFEVDIREEAEHDKKEAKNMQKPSIGRIVHYLDKSPYNNRERRRAAIIVEVHNETCVNLKVFNDSSEPDDHKTSVCYGDTYDNCWMWPPRV